MKIQRVIARNFRGQTIDRNLGPVTLITGDNFAGKTSIADAVRLSLAGYMPNVGKTAPLIWSNIAGNPDEEGTVEVRVELDGGRSSALTFARSKKGAVSQEGAVPVDLALDPMLLDVRSFFRLTAQERTSVIFRAAGDVNLTKEAVGEAIWNVEASPVSERDKVLRGLVEEVEQAFAKYPSPQYAVEALTTDWKIAATNAKTTAKIVEGAFAGLKLPQKMPVAPTGIQETKAIRDGLLVKRGELAALLRDNSRVAQLEVAIKETGDKVSELRTQLAAVVVPDEPEMPMKLTEYATAKTELDSLKERADAINAALKRDEEQLQSLLGVTICPCCGASGSLETARTNLRRRIAEQQASFDEAMEKTESIQARFEDLGSVSASYQAAIQEREEAVMEKNRLEALIPVWLKRFDEQRAELLKLQGDRSKRVEELTLEVEKLPGVETTLADLAAQQRDFDDYQRLLKERDAREKEALASACEATVLTGSVKALSELVAKTSEEAFGKVLKLSAAFTDGLLNSSLEFCDGELGRRVSDADRLQGRKAAVGAWIPWTSFSGTEELLAMAGFAVALARTAPFKLVILDELGRLTASRKEAVADRVVKLVDEGVIDQAILIDAGRDLKWVDESISVIAL